jgi:hypothetical protein
VPATCLSWASSIQSIPPHTTSLRSILILSYPSEPGSPQWSLFLRFPYQNKVQVSPLPSKLLTPPISFFSILSPAQYWVRITDHEAPLFVLTTFVIHFTLHGASSAKVKGNTNFNPLKDEAQTGLF